MNATGSGDSTIAGFAHAIAAGADDVTVRKTANTGGKLNARDPQTGHRVIERWDEVYNAVEVTELSAAFPGTRSGRSVVGRRAQGACPPLSR